MHYAARKNTCYALKHGHTQHSYPKPPPTRKGKAYALPFVLYLDIHEGTCVLSLISYLLIPYTIQVSLGN